jgi:hypothetical protein
MSCVLPSKLPRGGLNLLAFCSLFVTVSCKQLGDDDSRDFGRSADGTAMPRSSTGCQGFRDAVCDYGRRCGAKLTNCAQHVQGVMCISEETADECADEIDHSSCGDVPDECRPMKVAESSAAIQGCQVYVQAVCKSAASCRLVGSFDACMAAPTVDCRQALAVRADFPQCLTELELLSCNSWLPPEACRGTILLAPK